MRIDPDTKVLSPDDEDRPRFVPTAILDLNVPLSMFPKLPDGVVNAWVLQIHDKADVESYTPIAAALEKKFKAAIFVTYATERNPDSKLTVAKPRALGAAFTGKILYVTPELEK